MSSAGGRSRAVRTAHADDPAVPATTDRMTIAALVAAVAFLALYGFREIFGTDIGTLLALGRDVSERGGVPRTEPLTWSQQGQPFVNSWWLYALVSWKLYELGGTLLLSLASLLTAIAAVAIALERVRLRLGGIPAIAPLAVLVFGLSETFEIRPHIVSWAFLGATLWMIERERAHGGRALLGLPLLMVVWVNTHSFFVLGLVILAIQLVSVLAARPPRVSSRPLLIAAGSVLACLVSPYSVEALYAPLRDYRILASPLFSAADVGIVEFRPLYGIDLVQGEHLVLFQPQVVRLVYFVLAMSAVASLGRRLRLFDVLVACAFGYLALSATRNFALFFLATLPVVLDGTQHLLERWRGARVASGRRWLPVAGLSAAVVLMILTASGRLFAWQWQPYELGHAFSRSLLPVDAMAELREAGAEGRVVNALGDGGFIALTTGLPTYMDGRLFSEDAYRRYVASKSPEGIAHLLAESRPSVAVVRYDATWPWLSHFAYAAGWRVVYADTYRAVFLRRGVAPSLPELTYPMLEGFAAQPFTRDEIRQLVDEEASERPRSALAAAWSGAKGYPLDAARASGFYLAMGYHGPAAAVARDALLETAFRVPELYFYLGFALTGLGLEPEAADALRLYLRDGRTPDLVQAARTQLAALEAEA